MMDFEEQKYLDLKAEEACIAILNRAQYSSKLAAETAASIFNSFNPADLPISTEKDPIAKDSLSMTITREEMLHALQATKTEANLISEKLRADFAEHRGEMKAAVETLRADMHKASADNIKWIIGTIIALAAVTISILTFVINNAAKTQQSQQPVIINVPQPAMPAPTQLPK